MHTCICNYVHGLTPHPYTFVYINKFAHLPFRGYDGSHARATVIICSADTHTQYIYTYTHS